MPATMNAAERLLFEDLIRMNEIARRNERMKQQADQSYANIEASRSIGGLDLDLWTRSNDVGVMYNAPATQNQTWNEGSFEHSVSRPTGMDNPLAALPFFLLQLNSNNDISDSISHTTRRNGYPFAFQPPSDAGSGYGSSTSRSSTPGSAYYPSQQIGRTDSPLSALESPVIPSGWHVSSQGAPECTAFPPHVFSLSHSRLHQPQPQVYRAPQETYQHRQHQDYQHEYQNFPQQQVHVMASMQEDVGRGDCMEISPSHSGAASPSSEDFDTQIAASGGKVTMRERTRKPRSPYKTRARAVAEPVVKVCPMVGCTFTTTQENRTLRRHIGSCSFNPDALGYMCLGVHDPGSRTPCNTPLTGRKDALRKHAYDVHRQHMISSGAQLHFKAFPKSDMKSFPKVKKEDRKTEQQAEIAAFLVRNASVQTQAFIINTDEEDRAFRRFHPVTAHFLF